MRLISKSELRRVVVLAGMCVTLFFLVAVLLVGMVVMSSPVRAGTVYASWYGPGFHGEVTASGEVYDQNGNTCAHKSLPFGTILRVVNLNNGRAAFCLVNDRGPYVRNRVVDVSKRVAEQLGMINDGVVPVTVSVVED